MEENAVEVFHHYGVHLSSSLLMQIFSWLAGLYMETIWKNTGGFLYDCLIGMLLVSRSGLVEENTVEVFHYYGVHLCSSLLMQIFSWLAGLCYYGDDMEEYSRLFI